MRNFLFFFLGISLSFILIIPFANASDVGPFTGAPVSDRINYTSSPGTTYTKMVEQVSGPIQSTSDTFRIPNKTTTTLPNGIQIEAELVTDLSKDAVKAGIWNAIKKGKANPYVTACMVLCPALIEQGWKWMNDAKQWVRASEELDFNPDTLVSLYSGSSGLSGAYPTRVKFSEFKSYYNGVRYDGLVYTFQKVVSIGKYNGLDAYQLYHTLKYPNQIPISDSVKFYIHPGSSLPNQGDVAVSDADITNAVLDAMNKQSAADLIRISELDSAHDLSHAPQSVTSLTPQAETTEKTISRSTTNNQDGTQTQKEVKQKEVVKTETTTNNSTVNNTFIKYVTTTVTNTYINNNTVPETSTEEPVEDGGSVTPPDGPTFEELPVPKDFSDLPIGVSSFLNSIPSIPTSFSCSDPIFPFMTISFSLPLCEWIEHFRALFVWFWNILTAIAIYIMVRSMNVATGAVGGR